MAAGVALSMSGITGWGEGQRGPRSCALRWRLSRVEMTAGGYMELGRRVGFWVLHSRASSMGCRSEVVTAVCVGSHHFKLFMFLIIKLVD